MRIKPPQPEEFGLSSAKLERIDKKIWRVRVMSAIPVGLIGGSFALYSFYQFFVGRGSQDVNFDMFWVGLPISIFVGAATGMAFFLILVGLPVALFGDHDKERRYRAAVTQFRADERRSIHNYWANLSVKHLQEQVTALYARLGYEQLPPPEGAPDFVDFAMRKGTTIVLVCCRRQEAPVDFPLAKAMEEVQKHFKADRAVIISVPGFTPKARRWAHTKTVGLISVPELMNIKARLEAQEAAEAAGSQPEQV